MIPGFVGLTYYEILDISPGAEPKEIQEAYYRVRAAFSKNALASYSLYTPEQRDQILKLIEEAYHILFDTRAREEYDQQLGQEKLRARREAKALQEFLPLIPMNEETPPPELEPETKPKPPAAKPDQDQTAEDRTGKKPTEDRPPEKPESEPEKPETTAKPPSRPETEKPSPKPEAPAPEKPTSAEKKPKPEKPPPPDKPETKPEPAAPRPEVRDDPVKLEEREGDLTAPGPEARDDQTPAEPAPLADLNGETTSTLEKESGVIRPPFTPPGRARGISIREAQQARERQLANSGTEKSDQKESSGTEQSRRPGLPKPEPKPGPETRPAGPDLTDEVKKKISAPPGELPAPGHELFEDTIYDLPPPRKRLNPLDYLESEFSGKFLREMREAKSRSLDELWEATRIRKPILTAIEEENYKELPADVFLKGMLNIYVRFLELDDPEAVVKGYMERVTAARQWMD